MGSKKKHEARRRIAAQRQARKATQRDAARFHEATESMGKQLPDWRAWKAPTRPIPPEFYKGEFGGPKVPYSPQRGNCYIYALCDPITHRVRYVGKAYDPHARYDQHLTKSSWAVNEWVQGLRHKGLNPELKLLELCAFIYWQERERYWIWFFRQFLELLNKTDGGDQY